MAWDHGSRCQRKGLILKQFKSFRGTHIKISMSDHYTPTRMAVIKKTTSTGDDVEQSEVSYAIGGKAVLSIHVLLFVLEFFSRTHSQE